ncbi:YSIRK-type signal peptide-containing protein [Gemella haemolysans]|uniref:YSIRK-type signal peptide-containing protein n=1 Tax=Gemella haemolysans TaxID=1379 RepID=UPI00195B71DE|nr:YSIRK-type signal peptide-containing protein [Gemella haemolysans]VTX77708.1 IgA FC receptor [Gemella haemolysans]
MFNKKKYSIRKVSVGIVSVLIGIAAGSLGTVYAHEDVNNIVVNTEVIHDVNLEHVNKPVLEKTEKIKTKADSAPRSTEPNALTVCEDCKQEGKIIEHHSVGVTDKTVSVKSKTEEISLEKTSKTTEPVVTTPAPVVKVHKKEKLVESILEDKVDWNSIDEKEFVNYLLASIKVDKNKEQEIKTIWLVKVKELLAVNPNNENLKKVKSIIENTLKNEPSVEKEGEKETSKAASSKEEATNDKKQETPTNTAKVENRVLLAKLSGRDVAVLFDKDKIKADNVFVGSINDESLNKTIIEKLGSEYKVVEVFEIHFEKDGKKLDSDVERTVKMSVVKNDNAELEVYHIAENNELEKIKSSFNSGYIQFKINHFSKFTILERIRIGARDLESRVQIVTPVKAEYRIESKEENYNNKDSNDKKEVYNKEKIEELSKTGLETTDLLEVSLLILGVAVIIRRKQKQ